MSNGSRFLAAFNDIENLFHSMIGEDKHVDFAQLERAYDAKYRLPGQHREALRVFRKLRNTIVHSRYYGGQPIAEPVSEVVDQIERLRELLSHHALHWTCLVLGMSALHLPMSPFAALLSTSAASTTHSYPSMTAGSSQEY
jgi:hypothetical protein